MRFFKFVLFILLPVIMTSCGARKNVPVSKDHYSEKTDVTESTEPSEEIAEEPEISSNRNLIISKITDNAIEFLGTRYQYGGTSDKGMDCSGLIYTAFLKEEISLPRTSRDISLQGVRLNLDEVQKGDLLFFETNKKRRVINHVGLIVDVGEKEIFFIHSTTSRGVIISSLAEKYWQEHFVMARRVQ